MKGVVTNQYTNEEWERLIDEFDERFPGPSRVHEAFRREGLRLLINDCIKAQPNKR